MTGQRVVVGKRALLERSAVRSLQQLDTLANELQREGHTVVWVGIEGEAAGLLAISDPIKSSTPEAVENLHHAGLKIIMLTGDNKETARQVASRLKIDDIVAEITPAEKQAKVFELRPAKAWWRWPVTVSTMLPRSPRLMSVLPWALEPTWRCIAPVSRS